ncbi:MAG: hypothetical protein IT429_25705 [Gemmataceae bacterium]|nr:hypothetical protein [Gemmataceae bacterium]
MAVDVDSDTLAAVRERWQTDREFLPALLDAPPKAGRLKSPQPGTHAQVAVVPGQHVWMTGGKRIDKRKVTITIRGQKAAVSEALKRALDLFDRSMTLNYPSGAKCVGWLPLAAGRLEQEETTKEGLDVWRGILEGEAWSSRTEP